jgi:hypothetical protein
MTLRLVAALLSKRPSVSQWRSLGRGEQHHRHDEERRDYYCPYHAIQGAHGASKPLNRKREQSSGQLCSNLSLP